VRTLTPRESEVLERLACTGESNEEIADDLGLSEKTVRTYLRQIADITGQRTRGRMIVFAWQSGWLYRRLAEKSAA
jgi:DNA-binding NarL/FixJ family response regulator